MTNGNMKEIAFVLDKSGSMEDCVEDTIGGFNAFIEEEKRKDSNARVTLCLFDGNYELVYTSRPLAEVPKLTREVYKIGGSTALRDALGRTISNLGAQLAARKVEDRPDTIAVVVITDGEENSSAEISHQRLQEMIAHQTEKYNWNFIYLAEDVKSAGSAVNMGFNANNVVGTCTRSAMGVQSRYMAVNNALADDSDHVFGSSSMESLYSATLDEAENDSASDDS